MQRPTTSYRALHCNPQFSQQFFSRHRTGHDLHRSLERLVHRTDPTLKQTAQSFPFAATATTAAIAACAAIGLTFLAPNAGLREYSAISIPAIAIALTSVLIVIERHFHERGQRQGIANAQVDLNTGLPSRPVAELVLASEFSAAERGRTLSIVLFSIDHYHRFASQHGEDAAHRLLFSVGRILRKRTRGMNLSARYAGEGVFLSILSGEAAAGAATFAARVRKDLTSIQVEGEVQVVSAGIAEFDPDMHSPRDLVAAAQRALAAAQREGNRIVIDGQVDRPSASVR